MAYTQRRKKGFTLIEVLVVVTLIGIVLAISMPSLSSWVKGMRLNAQAREVFSAFQLARTEAVKRNTDVVMNFNAGSGENGTWEVSVGGASIASGNMSVGISIDNPDFDGNDETGYDSRGLPVDGRSGTVEVENDTKTYTITLSPGGSVKLTSN